MRGMVHSRGKGGWKYTGQECTILRLGTATDWACIHPTFVGSSPNAQCNGKWALGFWEVIRPDDEVMGAEPWDGTSAFTKRGRATSSPSSSACSSQGKAMWAKKEGQVHLQTRKRPLTRHEICWCLDLGLPASWPGRNKCFLGREARRVSRVLSLSGILCSNEIWVRSLGILYSKVPSGQWPEGQVLSVAPFELN